MRQVLQQVELGDDPGRRPWSTTTTAGAPPESSANALSSDSGLSMVGSGRSITSPSVRSTTDRIAIRPL